MSITLSGTTITYNDSSFQTTAPKGPGMYVSGGIYLGIFSTYHLLVSTYNYETTKQWKITNTSSSGTTSVDDGLANTNAMNDTTHPAAYYCATTMDGIGGVSDWYLPAKNELNMIYDSGGVVGGRIRSTYWSSSENNSTNSWHQNFSDGTQNNNNKNNTNYVRPVRR